MFHVKPRLIAVGASRRRWRVVLLVPGAKGKENVYDGGVGWCVAVVVWPLRDRGQSVAAGVAGGMAAAEPCGHGRVGCGKQGGWARVTQDEHGRF